MDPGSNPTRGNRLKSDPYIEDRIKKKKKTTTYNSIVNWLMARKAEKPMIQQLCYSRQNKIFSIIIKLLGKDLAKYVLNILTFSLEINHFYKFKCIKC